MTDENARLKNARLDYKTVTEHWSSTMRWTAITVANEMDIKRDNTTLSQQQTQQ